MDDFSFEPDLSRAHTIPSRWYVEPDQLGREQRKVFGRTWQLVGRAAQVESPGDFFTATVADEPVVVTRAEDGALHALSAVCRHRAGPVARGGGNRKTLQCGYHGWTYGLDGHLLSLPDWDGVRGFDRGTCALPSFRIEAWGPLLFVTLDWSARPLGDALGSIRDETRHLALERMRLVKQVDYEIACNWKVYVDNYLEGYHIPLVHPGLFRELDYAAYRVETGPLHSRQHAPLRERGQVYGADVAAGRAREALYYWIFPNAMLNFYPDNLQTNVVVPLGPERTLTRFEWYALDPAAADRLGPSIALGDQVQKEDVAICEAVQRGLRSRTYEAGRYSVLRENGVHHFHGLLSRFLSSPSS